ncbi:MoaD/ThiS family protein [Bathymodiolus japonicus methanotrophic gill symbiont]|uniref:MoaD/ThiS family protein n=1 Tax=Bathymodiolus japonicus methanotrophic gill symbiont TaxID=113269 RepID=UPI001C8EFAA7|nr:MoaD/ThiS family protein [Bathymodiolus japonicus methanotrophic gill symbiont]
MAIKVRYFASLKENLGRDKDSLDFEKSISVAEVWEQVMPEQAIPDNTLTAVNMEYVTLAHQVHDGDEVAFFPPVTGG